MRNCCKCFRLVKEEENCPPCSLNSYRAQQSYSISNGDDTKITPNNQTS